MAQALFDPDRITFYEANGWRASATSSFVSLFRKRSGQPIS